MSIHCDLLGENCVRAGPSAPSVCKGCAMSFHHACGAAVEGVEEKLGLGRVPILPHRRPDAAPTTALQRVRYQLRRRKRRLTQAVHGRTPRSARHAGLRSFAGLRSTFSYNSCWSPEHATAAEDAERAHPLVLAHRDDRLNALFEARRDAAFAQRAQPPPREAQPSSPFRGADADAPPASSLQAQAAPDETETPPPPPPGSTPAPPAEASRQAREEARTPATKSRLRLGSLLLLKSRHAVARVTELGADGVRVVVHPAASMFWHLPDGDNGTRLTLPLDEAEAALLCAQPLDPASSGTRKTTCLFGVPNMAVLGQKKFAVAAQRTGHPRFELGGSCSLMEGVTANSTAGVVRHLWFSSAPSQASRRRTSARCW